MQCCWTMGHRPVCEVWVQAMRTLLSSDGSWLQGYIVSLRGSALCQAGGASCGGCKLFQLITDKAAKRAYCRAISQPGLQVLRACSACASSSKQSKQANACRACLVGKVGRQEQQRQQQAVHEGRMHASSHILLCCQVVGK